MTIAALRALIDAEMPDVIRWPAPRRHPNPPGGTPMAPTTERPEVLYPVEDTTQDLITWGNSHADPATRSRAEQAETALSILRTRRNIDTELATLDREQADIERRLEALRERRAQLLPATKKAKSVRDYEPAAVRAWARERGVPCPERGLLPRDVLAAWREHHPAAGE